MSKKITRKKYKVYYYTPFGFAFEIKFAKSIEELILSEKIKEKLSSIEEYHFCPIEKEYIQVRDYDYDAIQLYFHLKYYI